jgi:hypothetical protein
MYGDQKGISYTIGYSARNVCQGSEVMFFSKDLYVPDAQDIMQNATSLQAA